MTQWRRFVMRPVAALALLTFAAAAVLWVRSYRAVDDLFLIYKGEGSEQLSSLRGELYFRHTLPHVGKRGGVARISHRTDRVTALPPRPWADDRLRPKWVIFRYDDSLVHASRRAPTLVMQKARAALLAFQAQRVPSTEPANPQYVAYRQRLQQLRDAYIQAQLQGMVFAPASSESYYAVTFPTWLLMVPAVLLVPVAWLASALRRARRARRGCCRACGYDLTGNASGVCPECGQPIGVASARPASG